VDNAGNAYTPDVRRHTNKHRHRRPAHGACTRRLGMSYEEGLRLLVRLKEQEQIRAARGKLTWDGDLDAMRRDDA
jgi:hypothetical protein